MRSSVRPGAGGLSSEVDVIVAQRALGACVVIVPHHDPPRQNANAAFEDAHIYVHLKAVYTLAVQKGLGKGDDRQVIGAQKLFHIQQLRCLGIFVERVTGRAMSLDTAATKPHERLAAALATDLDSVNSLIRDRMASENAPRIPEVTAHLIDAGGKRLRPMLTLAAARLCDYAGPYHIHLAATVEFIHTATLLHDDVVDESAQRRGRPTANLLWDNQSSVLVGDYLFARSFQLMVETGNMRVLDILANAAATIAEGEVLQLSSARNLDVGEDTYLRIVRGKTAALFSAATEVGGVIAGQGPDVVKALYDYGDALGVAFQIVDDLLDYDGTDATGKNLGDDFREGKLTLPVIRAIRAADAEERAFWQRTIGRGKVDDADLAHAMTLFAKHGTLEATRADALAWSARAKTALEALPAHELRDMLADLADYVIARLT